MKKLLLMLTCILLFSQIGFAESIDKPVKIGVVDLQELVNNSNQVNNLKNEHKIKIIELNSIITKAQEEISKEKDIKKIIEIQDKYTNIFNNKKSEIDKIYENKIKQIETKIKTEIEHKAKNDNYDLIFAKSVILFGGKDITKEVLPLINKK